MQCKFLILLPICLILVHSRCIPWRMRKSNGRLFALAPICFPQWVPTLALAWLTLLVLHAAAATFTVNSTAAAPDALPGDGTCDDGTGHCTLAGAAMESAFWEDITIILSVEGTIMGGAAFEGSSTLTLIGPGADRLTIHGDLSIPNAAQPVVSAITVEGALAFGLSSWPRLINTVVRKGGVTSTAFPSSTLELIGARIQDSPGAGVVAFGVSLQDTVVSNCGGAGVSAGGGLTAVNSRIENSAGPGVFVGNYRGDGGASLTDSTVSNNGGAGVDGQFAGRFDLIRSTIVGNRGDGVSVHGSFTRGSVTATLTDSRIDNNLGRGFAGDGVTNITRSTISRNGGGGVSVSGCYWGDNLIVTDSTIAGNSTTGSGGGILFVGSPTYQGSSPTLDHDTIVDNRAEIDGDGVGDGGGVSIAFSSGL